MYNGNMAQPDQQCPYCECGVDHHLYSCVTLVRVQPKAASMTINSFTGAYRFLSNFWPARVKLDGVEYPTSENAYQAAKTLDPELRVQFQTCSAGQSKKAGSFLTIRPDWDQVKVSVMEGLLEQKFAPGSELRAKLDKTRGNDLIEGNWWHDNFWGDCTCGKRAVCDTSGANHLGSLLMKIRDRTE